MKRYKERARRDEITTPPDLTYGWLACGDGSALGGKHGSTRSGVTFL